MASQGQEQEFIANKHKRYRLKVLFLHLIAYLECESLSWQGFQVYKLMRDFFQCGENVAKLSCKKATGQYLNLQDWQDQKEMNSLNAL